MGIIANVSAVLADAGANILDLSQSVMDEFFVMIMMVDVERAGVSFGELKARQNARGEEMGLRIDAQHEDVFKIMHRNRCRHSITEADSVAQHALVVQAVQPVLGIVPGLQRPIGLRAVRGVEFLS